MDGFHLSNAVLDRLGRRDRKGAVDTFDAEGFATAVERAAALRADDPAVYVPDFDRSLEDPVAASHALHPSLGLIVVEGNYLGLDGAPWRRVRASLSELWYLDCPADEWLRRLTFRHSAGGRAEQAARAYAVEVDGANAALVESCRGACNRVVDGRVLDEFG
jgi:pantothenate kinase